MYIIFFFKVFNKQLYRITKKKKKKNKKKKKKN